MKFKTKPFISSFLVICSIFVMTVAINNSKNNRSIRPVAAAVTDTKRVWATTEASSQWWFDADAIFSLQINTNYTHYQLKKSLNNKYLDNGVEYDIYYADIPIGVPQVEFFRNVPDVGNHNWSGWHNYSEDLFVIYGDGNDNSSQVRIEQSFTFNMSIVVADLIDEIEQNDNILEPLGLASIINDYNALKTYEKNEFHSHSFTSFFNGEKLMNYYKNIDAVETVRVWATLRSGWWFDGEAEFAIETSKNGVEKVYIMIQEPNNTYSDQAYFDGAIFYYDIPADVESFIFYRKTPGGNWNKSDDHTLSSYTSDTLFLISDGGNAFSLEPYVFATTKNVVDLADMLEGLEGLCNLNFHEEVLTYYHFALSTYEINMFDAYVYPGSEDDTTGAQRIAYLNSYFGIENVDSHDHIMESKLVKTLYNDYSTMLILIFSFVVISASFIYYSIVRKNKLN